MQSFFRLFRIDMALPMSKSYVAYVAQALLPVRLCVCAALLCFSASLNAQAVPAVPQNPVTPPAADKPSISLSPAVVMAKGSFNQTLTQTLTLTNQTGRDFAFELVAEDVLIKDGKRIFVAAGETPNSIASSAVFTQKTVLVMFRGTDKLPTSSGAVGMTASLGALITFNLTDDVKLKPEPVRVIPASETANMKIAQWISNTGTEPVLPEGAAAVLNSNGGLVGNAIFDPQRLLPGERLEFSAEYPGELPPGKYRALCSFQFEGKTQTTEAAFEIPKAETPGSKTPTPEAPKK